MVFPKIFSSLLPEPLTLLVLMIIDFVQVLYLFSSFVSTGVAASSLFTSGKYVIDPELRGSEFERITQNLDVNFWKSFWNITETEILASLASIASTQVKVNKGLSVPPNSFELPLATDPNLTVTVTPPVAHSGPGAVQMRLLSYVLREGQDSEELNSFMKVEGQLNLDLRLKTKIFPRSSCLLIHFHGGGFVAQTSKSHEPYLKTWTCDLDMPILSVDYSLAPEAPFPRALEECFFAYCWAVKNCHLLGSTGEKICLAGDSAGGNLCITVSMRAAAYGVRIPDGVMAAYPATLLQATASPSRLLTLMDPLLPLSVLSKCLSAYAGIGGTQTLDKKHATLSTVGLVRRDTALLFRDLRLGASALLNSLLDSGRNQKNPEFCVLPALILTLVCAVRQCLWTCLHRPLTFLMHLLRFEKPAFSNIMTAETVRKSVSETALSEETLANRQQTLKSKTCQNFGKHLIQDTCSPLMTPKEPKEELPVTASDRRKHSVTFFLEEENEQESADPPGKGNTTTNSSTSLATLAFPEGFEPLRSTEGFADMTFQTSPIVRNPFMSPLLAPDEMLLGLPRLHIVACALDPMLDDSVMFAKRLRNLGKPVELCVVEDLPHGFLSLSQLSRDTKDAAGVCIEQIRKVIAAKDTPVPTRKHRKLERIIVTEPSKTPESPAQKDVGA
ncbi:hormone-sensitive lipase [Protopterus annectens]|uniref:hormone-sensitive lipase n=1 Tax=Protopterus annectens TaxID=7888 RepID=UPI001CF9CB02|nr:hormone-sensitive lipase [Protopterus annectens]